MHFSTLKGSLLLLAALGSISGASARALPAGSELSTFDSQFAERAVTLDVRTGSGTGSSSGNKRPATDPPADDPSTKKQNTGTSPPPASPPPATAPTTAQQPIGLPNGPKSKDPKMVSLFQNCVNYLTPAIVPKDKALYYTSAGAEHPDWDSYADAGEAYAAGHKLIEMGMAYAKAPADTIKSQMGPGGDEYVWITSAAFGKAGSGKVYLLMPAEGLKSATYFTTYEWPELIASGKVTQIIWVDPSKPTADPSTMTKVLWKTGDGAKKVFPLNTPVDKM